MRTTSPGASLRTISPYTQGMGGNLPGQSVTLCGQPIQVAACGSHSAGMTKPSAISRQLADLPADGRRVTADGSIGEKTMLNAAVCIGAPVAQERPVAADFLDPSEIDLRQHECLVLGGLDHHHAERVTDERMAPEFDPGAFAAQPLESAAVHGGNPAAVRNRMTA